jgi:hypothetical protein
MGVTREGQLQQAAAHRGAHGQWVHMGVCAGVRVSSNAKCSDVLAELRMYSDACSRVTLPPLQADFRPYHQPGAEPRMHRSSQGHLESLQAVRHSGSMEDRLRFLEARTAAAERLVRKQGVRGVKWGTHREGIQQVHPLTKPPRQPSSPKHRHPRPARRWTCSLSVSRAWPPK